MKSLPSYRKIALVFSCLIVILLVSSLVLIIGSKHQSNRSAANKHIVATVYQNGTLLTTIDLTRVTEAYSFTVTGENQCTNEVTVRPGSIGISSASCPDKLCVHQGYISDGLLPITCLPNHLVIQTKLIDVGEGKDDLTNIHDAVSY